MSYFNEDQQDYMRSLAAIPPEQKCWCGWYSVGECHTCPPEKTNADKIATLCPECRNEKSNYGTGPIIHIRGCSLTPPENEPQ